jgi:ATP-dependent exoDNAse (exonuclease V) alpha subunit
MDRTGLPIGTQYDPVEIDSSPEPEPAGPFKDRNQIDLIRSRYTTPEDSGQYQVAKDATATPYQAATDTTFTDIVPIVEPTLCKEQADLVDLILTGRNVFYTGSAGCGKSTVLKSFVQKFRGMGMQVDIVAPTGRAALDINGSTTWTYAGE